MFLGGSWWFLVFLGGSCWFLVVFGGSGLFFVVLVALIGSWGFSVVLCGLFD